MLYLIILSRSNDLHSIFRPCTSASSGVLPFHVQIFFVSYENGRNPKIKKKSIIYRKKDVKAKRHYSQNALMKTVDLLYLSNHI